MSRFGRSPLPTCLRAPLRYGILRVWHVVCISSGAAGCIPIWLPPVEEPRNVPPEITSALLEPGEVWELQAGPNTAFVFAFDEDEGHTQKLDFFWTLGRFGELGTAVPVPGRNWAGSQLTLVADRKYDGSTLRCRVVDPQGASAEIAWEVSYTEEDR
jgi:hypothetical protein